MQAATAFHRESVSAAVSGIMNESSLYLNELRHLPPTTAPAEDPSMQRARWVVRTVIIIVLFFASIHGFAHLIYPLIPVERGGGRYLTGTVVDLCVRPPGRMFVTLTGPDLPPTSAPLEFCALGLRIPDAIVLEQEPDALYVTSVHDPGVEGGAISSRCGLDKWHEGINPPRIMAFNSADVIEIRDKDSVAVFCEACREKGVSPKPPPSADGAQ
jgi:hypothetical protein